MRRVVGALLVLAACILLASDGMSWDSVVVDLPGSATHGLHASELIGFVLAALGVALVWIGGSRR